MGIRGLGDGQVGAVALLDRSVPSAAGSWQPGDRSILNQEPIPAVGISRTMLVWITEI